MSPLIATILIGIGIIGLFVLDRNGEAQASKALWIPVVYLCICGSRSVSAWLGVNPLDEVNGVYSSPIDAAVNLVLLALGLIVLIARRRQSRLLLRRSGAVLLFYSYGLLSVLWSDLPFITFKHWTKGVEDVVMVLIVLTDKNPIMALRRLLTRSGFVLIPLSLLLSRYYPSLGRGWSKSYEALVIGVTTEKNSLGIICLVFGLGSLWCFLRAYGDRKSAVRSRRLLAHGAMLGIVVWLLEMSHSLTASVSFVLASGVLVLASRLSTRTKTARVHLIVGAALCIALFPLFVAPTLVQSLGRDTTFSGRTKIWHILPGLVKNPWLGAGYETFLVGDRLVQLHSIIDKTFQEAHDGYLEVYLNLGWIGVSLFVLLLATGYQKIVAAFRRDPAGGSLRLAFFVAVLIEGLTEASFRMLTLTWFVLLWAIISASKAVPYERSVRKPGEFAQCDGPVLAFGDAKTIVRPRA
jgi:O-antigen ligase